MKFVQKFLPSGRVCDSFVSFDCIFWLVVEHLVARDLVVSFAVKSSSGRSELLLGELWFLIFKFFDVHLVSLFCCVRASEEVPLVVVLVIGLCGECVEFDCCVGI